MAAILALHKIVFGVAGTPGSTTYFFYANPASYDTLATPANVSLASDAEKANNPALSVSQILGTGKFQRVSVSYRLPSGRRRSASLICSTGRIKAMQAKEGKTYRTGTIISVIVPRRATDTY